MLEVAILTNLLLAIEFLLITKNPLGRPDLEGPSLASGKRPQFLGACFVQGFRTRSQNSRRNGGLRKTIQVGRRNGERRGVACSVVRAKRDAVECSQSEQERSERRQDGPFTHPRAHGQ